MSMELYLELRKIPDPQERARLMAELPQEQKDAVMAARERYMTKGYNNEQAGTNFGLQGYTHNYADEIGSVFRHLPGGETPQEYRDRIRQTNEDLAAIYPSDALTGELAGAGLAAITPVYGRISGPVRVKTGLTALSTAGRLAMQGMGYGALDAALGASGKAEGGVGPRLTAAAEAAPTGALFGLGGVVAGKVLQSVATKWGATAASAIAGNVRAIAAKSGRSASAVLADVLAGKPIAGQNKTTRHLTQQLAAQFPELAEQMAQEAAQASEASAGRVMRGLEDELMPGASATDNLLQAGTDRFGAPAVKQAGDTVKDTLLQAQPDEALSQEMLAASTQALQRNPDLADKINTTLQARGEPPLTRVGDAGEIILTRVPSVLEMEMMRRTAKGMATQAFTNSNGELGEALEEGIAKPLRTVVDKAAGVAEARAGSAMAKANQEAHELGLRAAGKSPDAIQMEMAALAPEAREAYRAGMAASVRAAGSRSQPATLFNQIEADTGLGPRVTAATGKTPKEIVGGPTIKMAQANAKLAKALEEPGLPPGEMPPELSHIGGGFFEGVNTVAQQPGILGLAAQTVQLLAPDRALTPKQAEALAEYLLTLDPVRAREALRPDASSKVKGWFRDQVDTAIDRFMSPALGIGVAGEAAAQDPINFFDMMEGP